MLDENDHRSLGQRLDLFHFQEEAPGMAFWHPNGFLLYRLLEDAVRSELLQARYAEVRTPQLLRRSVWEASGHWEHFSGAMFKLEDQSQAAALKPVSCPGHVYIAGRRAPSYRDLPLRFAEFGTVHRDEPSGTLHGLMRLRQFTQDDGHVFCTPEQAADEVERFCRSVPPFYARFGFPKLDLVLSTRPAERAGDDASWDRAEAALYQVVKRLGWKHSLAVGGGAFYGPKLEFVLQDRLGREWQCGTIQFDLVMPRRFELDYVDRHGGRSELVMLHRAIYGSLERFLGVLLEQHGAALPEWLAPEQLRLLPLKAAELPFAEDLERRFRDAGMRVSLDARAESLARRIAEAHEAAVPFVGVIGGREVSDRSLSVRSRDGQRTLPVDHAIAELASRTANPFGRPQAA